MFHLYLGIFSLTENVEKHFQFKKSGSLIEKTASKETQMRKKFGF